MQVQVKKPELEKFITDQVAGGHFPSREAAVEAAIAQMKSHHDDFNLTDDDIAAIEESEEQIERGEVVDFDTFAADMRRKYCGN